MSTESIEERLGKSSDILGDERMVVKDNGCAHGEGGYVLLRRFRKIATPRCKHAAENSR